MARRVCLEPGCPALTDKPRCPAHTRDREAARGSKEDRGYGRQHQAERRRWRAIIDSTGATCARCGAPLRRGDAFHLDHTADRRGWLGPSCPKCNLSAAGKASHGL